jgi:endonuclease/exonuclease/phosphatase family metal-dependent hydrolase
MGVHALRSFWSMLVWNIAEDRAPPQIALIALLFWGIGLLAWPITRALGGTRPAWRFGLVFGVVYVANQAIVHPVLTPWLGIAGGVVWLWFFPALLVSLCQRDAAGATLPGILLGITAQVALQAALHGLDMPVLHGSWPAIGGLLLASGLIFSLRAVLLSRGGAAKPGQLPGWGLAAFGPFLILELVLLANPGRIGALSGWPFVPSVAFIFLGLTVAVAALARLPSPAVRGGAGVLAVATLARPAWVAGSGIWLLVATQGLLAPAMASALAPVPGDRPGRSYGWFAAGAVAFFVLMFLYYRRYGWPELWLIMATLAVLPAVATRPAAVRAPRAAVALALVVALAGGGLALIAPRRGPLPASAPADLAILDYNIHEGFNVWSLPDPLATTRVIAEAGADLIALQEVGRGWNINGGVDLVAWLAWRFPEYRITFAPFLGELVGFAVLSRYPIGDTGRLPYPQRMSRFSYGLQWAVIPTAAGDLLFVNTHFSPYVMTEADRSTPAARGDRYGQAQDLLRWWSRRARTIVAGDFNAGPDEEAITLMRAAGFFDVGAPHGLAAAWTYDALTPDERRDYIFASRDVESLAAAIPPTTASDHLPVFARLRLR